ncbi:lysine transporter LysE [Streptomyces sp. NPDC049813]|uniref:lysine transporter LysE n=1 Tax=Streptomyces sp. NPDC049813 TaxID=3365597 RepID=UPI0037A85343
MRVEGFWKGLGEFLTDTVGDAVAEVVLTVLACALLAALAGIAYLSWSFSPRGTLAGAGVFSLLFAHGVWRLYRKSVPGRGHRVLAAVTTTLVVVTACTVAFLLFYASGCGCV